jgi:hypothetical protein
MHSTNHLPPIFSLPFPFRHELLWDPSFPQERGDDGEMVCRMQKSISLHSQTAQNPKKNRRRPPIHSKSIGQ